MRLAPRAWRAGRRDLRLWRVGRRLPGAPAYRSIARRSRGCIGSIPSATIFAEQSEEAIAAGAFHNDVVAVANERVLFAHEQAFADKEPLIDACERLVPGFEYVEVPAADVPLEDAVRSYLFNAQLVTPPDGETDADRADRGARDAVGVALDRAARRRQRPDPPGRGGGRSPVDGERRRPRLPAPARGRRSGDASTRASSSTRRSSTGSPT